MYLLAMNISFNHLRFFGDILRAKTYLMKY
jgi:hypothetical protein